MLSFSGLQSSSFLHYGLYFLCSELPWAMPQLCGTQEEGTQNRVPGGGGGVLIKEPPGRGGLWAVCLSCGIWPSESEVSQSCPTLCDPMDCRLPGSSVHGIFRARVLEWVAISFSRGSSQPRDQTRVSHIVGRRFTIWATREAQWGLNRPLKSLPGNNGPAGHTLGAPVLCKRHGAPTCVFERLQVKEEFFFSF